MFGNKSSLALELGMSPSLEVRAGASQSIKQSANLNNFFHTLAESSRSGFVVH
jgi:hypothetical protein